MNGPIICRLREGRARRTSISPRSTARGTISVSMASVLARSPGTGSGQGLQLMIYRPPIAGRVFRSDTNVTSLGQEWCKPHGFLRATSEWRAYTEHPFTNGLADGTLAENAFRY